MKTFFNKKLLWSSFLVLPLLTIACANTKEEAKETKETKETTKEEAKANSVTLAATDLEKNINYGQLYNNAYVSAAAEYKAMALSTYNSAAKAFDLFKTQESIDSTKVSVANDKVTVTNPEANKKIPVVWIDLDDTVLKTFAYQNYNLLNNQSFNRESWEKFVKAKKSSAIAGAINFIKHVWNNGGVVIFNSNRELLNHRDATRQNLVSLGLEAKYMPDWIWWLQGSDLKSSTPWKISTYDPAKNKSAKEARLNYLNENSFNLQESNEANGNSVSFRSILRIGDNLDDFNDHLTKRKNNQKRSQIVLEKMQKLFGNFDLQNKGLKADREGNISETPWSESYFLVGANAAYGGWVAGLARASENFFSLTNKEKIERFKDAFKAIPIWDGN